MNNSASTPAETKNLATDLMSGQPAGLRVWSRPQVVEMGDVTKDTLNAASLGADGGLGGS